MFVTGIDKHVLKVITIYNLKSGLRLKYYQSRGLGPELQICVKFGFRIC